jgi:hypothetical protein
MKGTGPKIKERSKTGFTAECEGEVSPPLQTPQGWATQNFSELRVRHPSVSIFSVFWAYSPRRPLLWAAHEQPQMFLERYDNRV